MASSCLRSAARSILLISNVFFALAGLGVLAVGIYLRTDAHWSSLLNSPGGHWSSDVMIGVGAFTFLVSLLGCAGAVRIKHSRCLLSVYVILLAAVLLVQAIATAVWIDVDSTFARTINGQVNLTNFQSEVLDKIENAAISVYKNGGCTADPARLPDPVTCTDPRAQWVASYVNEVCVPEGLDDSDLLKDPTNFLAIGLAMSRAGVDVPQVLGCVQRQNTPLPAGADTRLVWGYCMCERPLTEKLRSLLWPASIVLVAVTGVEVVVFLSAIALICCRRRGGSAAGLAVTEAGAGSVPLAIPMGGYAHHRSPPKVVVHQRGAIHMV